MRFDANDPEDVARVYALGLTRDVVVTAPSDAGDEGLLCEPADGQDHAGDTAGPPSVAGVRDFPRG